MTQISSLTPMLVQYLVGLCCLRWDPEAIEITIGDMVFDQSAEKDRDVDVTVTVSDSGQNILAFKAYEVKRERSPLDVTHVEQLSAKLRDMPSITHRAIVSSSGYTDAARKKAAAHSIDLYELKPWTRPLEEQFPSLKTKGTAQERFRGTQALLCWIEPRSFKLVAPTAEGPFSVGANDELYEASGSKHSAYPTFAEYQREILFRSTGVLCTLEPAATVLTTFPMSFDASGSGASHGPHWPHTHTLDVASDGVFVQTSQGVHLLTSITVNGHLQWQRGAPPVYSVMQNVADGTAFAGALLHAGPKEGQMTALMFSPTTATLTVHSVQLPERHKNMIRMLKLRVGTR